MTSTKATSPYSWTLASQRAAPPITSETSPSWGRRMISVFRAAALIHQLHSAGLTWGLLITSLWKGPLSSDKHSRPSCGSTVEWRQFDGVFPDACQPLRRLPVVRRAKGEQHA